MENNHRTTIDYQYDKNSRLVKCHVQGERANEYIYDPTGNLLFYGDTSMQHLYRPNTELNQGVPEASRSYTELEWRCVCGSVNKGGFCPKCGTKRSTAPSAPADRSWRCACGSVNKGGFCPKCGAKRP